MGKKLQLQGYSAKRRIFTHSRSATLTASPLPTSTDAINRVSPHSPFPIEIAMAPLPDYRPKQLSLGPLEAEILNIIWELGSATVKDVHDRILTDPNRELAYTSVTTVLRRLTDKGWLACDKKERAFYWRPMLSKQQSDVIKAHEQLQRFLAVGNPDVIAAFADSLDEAASEQIAAIAKRIQSARQAREEK